MPFGKRLAPLRATGGITQDCIRMLAEAQKEYLEMPSVNREAMEK
jgi:hypothetical protein